MNVKGISQGLPWCLNASGLPQFWRQGHTNDTANFLMGDLRVTHHTRESLAAMDAEQQQRFNAEK